MKIVTVVGARPQFIKAATVSRIISVTEGVQEVLVHTGQHYDINMSDVFFEELEIPQPDYNLGIGGASHGAMTGRQLEAVEKVLFKERPEWVLVYGDTNSTLAGALAATKLHISVAHVEAGLRSFNRQMPEEINRVLTDHVADVLFAPTENAVTNLVAEGLQKNTHRVGDVMYDAALFYANKAENNSQVLSRVGVHAGEYFLATIHRAENTDDNDRLRAIVSGLCKLAQEHQIVLPLHPRTYNMMQALDLFDSLPSGIKLIEPLGYLDMIMLEKHARLVVTDSGGVQKEAFFHRVPCVTLRDETEWVELVEMGWNRLVSETQMKMLPDICLEATTRVGEAGSPYGEGNTAQKILDVLTGTG